MSSNLDILGGITDLAAVKNPCAAATTVDLTDDMIGLIVVDGYQTVSDDRILVRANADPSTNGIFNAQLSAWTPAIDFSINSGVVRGTQVLVTGGNTFANVIFQVTTPNPVIVGDDDITFAPLVAVAPIPPTRVPWREIAVGMHTDTATPEDGAIYWGVFYSGTKVQTILGAASVPAGQTLRVIDGAGDCTVNPIQLVPQTGTINKAASLTMGRMPGSAPGMSIDIQSDGVGNWVLT